MQLLWQKTFSLLSPPPSPSAGYRLQFCLVEASSLSNKQMKVELNIYFCSYRKINVVCKIAQKATVFPIRLIGINGIVHRTHSHIVTLCFAQFSCTNISIERSWYYLSLDAEKRCEKTSNSDRCKVLSSEISIKSFQLIERKHDAEQIYQNPQSIEDVVPIRSLCKYYVFCSNSKILLIFTLQILFSVDKPGPKGMMVDEYERRHLPQELHSEMLAPGL